MLSATEIWKQQSGVVSNELPFTRPVSHGMVLKQILLWPAEVTVVELSISVSGFTSVRKNPCFCNQINEFSLQVTELGVYLGIFY